MAGMTVLLLLLWAGVTVSSPVDLQKRIFGGKTCDKATRHYHVFVEGSDGTLYFKCGGSLIHKNWVLTAGHCKKREMTLYLGVHPGPLNVHTKVGVTKKKQYRKFIFSHDLMLLKLETPSSITPIQLPTDEECENQAQIKEIEVAGYGATTKGGEDTPSLLQCGNIPVKSLNKETFCYESSSVGTQPGDSGGGVVYKNKIYGVHVTGLHTCVSKGTAKNLCNKDYRKWINKTINSP